MNQGISYQGLIVGLGNPGAEYAATRHNIGFMLVDAVLAEIAAKPYRRRTDLESTDLHELYAVSLPRVRGEFLLAKPQTFMNRSGVSVARICRERGVKPQQILVVHDELDLPLGRMKLKRGGGGAGHNGIASLVGELGTEDFTRLRVGIGRPEASWQVRDWVLSPFAPEEQPVLAGVLEAARDRLPLIFSQPFARAQQAFNAFDGRPAPAPEAAEARDEGPRTTSAEDSDPSR